MAIVKISTSLVNSHSSIAGYPNTARTTAQQTRRDDAAGPGKGGNDSLSGFDLEVFGTTAGFGAAGTDGTNNFEVLDAVPAWYLNKSANIHDRDIHDSDFSRVRLETDIDDGANYLQLRTAGAIGGGGHIRGIQIQRGAGTTRPLLFSGVEDLVYTDDSEDTTLEANDEITDFRNGVGVITRVYGSTGNGLTGNTLIDVRITRGSTLLAGQFGLGEGIVVNTPTAAERDAWDNGTLRGTRFIGRIVQT